MRTSPKKLNDVFVHPAVLAQNTAPQRLIEAIYLSKQRPADVRILAWENPKKTGEYLTGFVVQRYSGRAVTNIALYALDAYTSRNEAKQACNALAGKHSFAGFTTKLALCLPQARLIARSMAHVPFKALPGWKSALLPTQRLVA